MELDTPGEDGKTLREHLLQVYEQTKNLPERPPQLELLEEEPETPFEVEYILDIFFEINTARSAGGFSSNPLSFSEIKAWTEMRQFPLTFWEVHVIKRLDSVYLSNQIKKSRERAKKAKNK